MTSAIDESATTRTERLFSGYAGRLLAVVSLGTMTGMSARLVLSPLLPTVASSLAITPARSGVALSVMWVFGALTQFPGGRLADAWSRKTVLVASLGLLALGTALLFTTTSYLTLLVGVAVMGTGAGLYPPAAVTQLSELFVARRGQAISVNSSAINVGGVLAAGLAAVMLATATWRTSFLVLTAGLAVVLVVMHRLNAEPYAVSRVSLDLRGTGARLLRSPHIRAALLAYTLFEAAWLGTTSFLPTYLQTIKGFSPGLASNAFAGLFVVGIVANPVAGRLADRGSYLRVATGAAVLATGGLSLLVFAGTHRSVLLAVLVAATGLAAFWPAMHAYTMATLGAANRGGDFGAIRSLFIGVGALGPAAVGVLAERTTFDVAYLGLACCLLASAAVVYWLVRRDIE